MVYSIPILRSRNLKLELDTSCVSLLKFLQNLALNGHKKHPHLESFAQTGIF